MISPILLWIISLYFTGFLLKIVYWYFVFYLLISFMQMLCKNSKLNSTKGRKRHIERSVIFEQLLTNNNISSTSQFYNTQKVATPCLSTCLFSVNVNVPFDFSHSSVYDCGCDFCVSSLDYCVIRTFLETGYLGHYTVINGQRMLCIKNNAVVSSN